FYVAHTPTAVLSPLSLHDALPICADRGQRRLPGGLVAADIGFEFLATFRDTSDAELRIVPGYSPYVGGDAIDSLGDDYGRFARRDRKSTRLNSSHVKISYAVFCLK